MLKRKFDCDNEENNKTNIEELIESNSYKIYDSYNSQINSDKIVLYDNHIHFNAIISEETIQILIRYINTVIGNMHLFTVKNVYIHISSKGGYFRHILDFLQYKNTCNCELISIIENECVDSGFILAALCDYRIINKNAKCLLTKIDSENSYFWSYFCQCINSVEQITQFKNMLYHVLTEVIDSKLTHHKLDAYLNEGCNWCSKKYKKLGLADEIV